MATPMEVRFVKWLQDLLLQNKSTFGVDTLYTKSIPSNTMPTYMTITWDSVDEEQQSHELQVECGLNLEILIHVSGAGAEVKALEIAVRVRNFIRQQITNISISGFFPPTLFFGQIQKAVPEEDEDGDVPGSHWEALLPLSIGYEYPMGTGS